MYFQVKNTGKVPAKLTMLAPKNAWYKLKSDIPEIQPFETCEIGVEACIYPEHLKVKIYIIIE